MCPLLNAPLYPHERLRDHFILIIIIIIHCEDLKSKAFKNSADWKDGVIRLKCNLQQTIYALIENDHLGDCSPEKDCCWLLTFRQPVQKPSSDSSLTLKMA